MLNNKHLKKQDLKNSSIVLHLINYHIFKYYKIRIKINFYSKNSTSKKMTNANYKNFTWNSFSYGIICGIIITILSTILLNKIITNTRLKIKSNSVNTITTKQPKYNTNSINHKSESKFNNNNNNYDFYNLLSNPKTKNPEQKNYGKYMLEIGNFNKISEADELKAKLALIGFEAKIQTINTNHNQLKTFKLIIGPYNSQNTAIFQKNKLSQSGIQNVLIKNL